MLCYVQNASYDLYGDGLDGVGRGILLLPSRPMKKSVFKTEFRQGFSVRIDMNTCRIGTFPQSLKVLVDGRPRSMIPCTFFGSGLIPFLFVIKPS